MSDARGGTTVTEDRPMPFECPFCFEPHDAPLSDAGHPVTCPCCGASFVVPLSNVPLAPAAQAPPLVITYSPVPHGSTEPDAGDDRDEPDTARPRRTPRECRLRQARETRAKWMLLMKIGVVVALGVAAVIAVLAASQRVAERRDEAQKAQQRR